MYREHILYERRLDHESMLLRSGCERGGTVVVVDDARGRCSSARRLVATVGEMYAATVIELEIALVVEI